ncbi:hypothetical protein ACN2CC_03275 [Mesorhizobium muleiense]|uniref:hypothetical protein n=2 Tax=Mesorhizobium TaxID=68287 RepID=UPI003AFA8B12
MPATKDQWKAFREELSQQLEDERRFIANAEAGKTGIWSVQPGKGKVDTTAAHVEISRRAVQALEGWLPRSIRTIWQNNHDLRRLPTKSDYLGQLGDVAIDYRTFDEKTLVTEDFEEGA